MTVPVDAILAARAADPDLSHKAIARLVGSSAGSVQRALSGRLKSPQQYLKAQPRPFRRVSYAGYAGGREWNDYK